MRHIMHTWKPSSISSCDAFSCRAVSSAMLPSAAYSPHWKDLNINNNYSSSGI